MKKEAAGAGAGRRQWGVVPLPTLLSLSLSLFPLSFSLSDLHSPWFAVALPHSPLAATCHDLSGVWQTPSSPNTFMQTGCRGTASHGWPYQTSGQIVKQYGQWLNSAGRGPERVDGDISTDRKTITWTNGNVYNLQGEPQAPGEPPPSPSLGLVLHTPLPYTHTHTHTHTLQRGRCKRQVLIAPCDVFPTVAGFKVVKDAAPGQAGSINLLKSKASKHEPYLQIAADRTMTISVRGTEGSTTSLHPQAYGTHWIDLVYVKDQEGNIVCEHRFSSTETTPVHKCTKPLAASVTAVMAFESCNLHGLWVGPTLQVGWEVAVAKVFARATQSTAVNPSYFHSPAMVVAGAPVKHEAKIMGVGKETTIVVLGGGGSDINLHPHSFNTHYIEAVFAKDQHGAVAVYQVLGASVTTAQSKPFAIPPSATSLEPYEFCNLHGLWAGATWTSVTPSGDMDCPHGYVAVGNLSHNNDVNGAGLGKCPFQAHPTSQHA